MEKERKSFLGTGWAFPPAFNFDRGTLELANGEEDIKQSLRIIIGTIPGERIMFPTFGCGIHKFVFESKDPTHLSILKDSIYDAILYHEPRIKLEKIEITEDLTDYGKIYVHITYTVIITNTRSNMVYPFYLNEGTNL